MSSTRDPVRFESNERVDLGDLIALQSNARSYSHLAWRWFTSDLGVSYPSHVVRGFLVTPDAPPSASIFIANGLGLAGIVLEDGVTVEQGVWFGQEGPSSQALSFTGQPAATYNIYLRASLDAGQIGTRIFWNENTAAEEADNIDTRYEFGWDVTFATSSPGTEWQKIAEVVWNGATVSSGDITMMRDFYWEGREDTSFGYGGWGGGTDRNADRATYGVFFEKKWIQALRTQLRGIIDGAGDWWDLPQADLAEARAHFDTVIDPHTDSPQWTGNPQAQDFTVVDTITSDTFHFDATRNFIDVVSKQVLKLIAADPNGGGSGDGPGNGNLWTGAGSIQWRGSGLSSFPEADSFGGWAVATAVDGDAIYVPISEYMRYGATLYQVIVEQSVSNNATDALDVECQLAYKEMGVADAGAPTTFGTLAAAQPLVDETTGAARGLITYTLNEAIPGWGDVTGRQYYVKLTARNDVSAPSWALYNVVLRWQTNDIRYALGVRNS